MTHHDKTGRRVPAPRHDTVPSNNATIALVLVALVLIVGVSIATLSLIQMARYLAAAIAVVLVAAQ